MKGKGSRKRLSVTRRASRLTENKVISLMRKANISSTDFEFLVPEKNDRANKPPEGYISVYKDQILWGLRFPLHPLVVEICNRMKVSPSQLTPDAHSVIVAFVLCAKLYDNIPVSADCFFSLFSVSRHDGEMFFRFQQRRLRFLLDIDSSGTCKRSFFFLRPVGKSWNCPTEWGDMFRLTPRIDPAVRESFQEMACKSGITKHLYNVDGLIHRDLLVHGGIEPPGPQSPKFTFRYLMRKHAVIKFELQPEDIPPANATNMTAKKRPLHADASKVHIVTPSSSSGDEVPLLEHFPKAEEDHDADASKVHIVTPSSSSGDEVPLLEHFPKEEADHAAAHNKANRAVLVGSQEAQPPSTPPALLADDSKVHLKELVREREEDLAEAHNKANRAVLGSQEAQPPSTPSALLADDAKVHLKELVREREEDRAEAHNKVNHVVLGSQEGQPQIQSASPTLIALSKTLESTFVPKELYEKLQKEKQEVTYELASTKSRVEEVSDELAYTKFRVEEVTSELASSKSRLKEVTSELALTKSRVEEVTSELALTKSRVEEVTSELTSSKSRLKEVTSELVSTKSRVKEVNSELTSTQSRVVEVTSELASTKSRVEELEQEIKLYKSKRVDLEYKTSQAMVKVKMLEKRLETVKSDSDCLRDKIKKDVIKEFKSSDEFTNTVQEEAVKYYMNGFDVCKMRVLNSGKLPSGFNFDLLDVADAEWGSSPGAEDNAATKQDKKPSFKRKRT